MAKVSKKVIESVQSEISILEENDPSVINTCGLCNRTLYDNLMQIAVKTGAPQKTVCNVFAEFYNEGKRSEDQVEGKSFDMRMSRITKVNEDDLKSRSVTISNESNTASESDDPVDVLCEVQETFSQIESPEEPVETITSTQSSLGNSTERDPYDVLVELWHDKQYTVEDAYEIFVTELLGRFKPNAVDQYRHNAGVKLDDLGMIIGKTVRQNDGLSPEELHHVIRSGLETFGGWKKYRIEKAIGTVPLTPEQRAAGDF